MRQFFHSRSLFVKMIVSFTVVLSIVTLVLSYLLYANFERVALNAVTKTNTKFLSQLSYSANYMNDSAKNFAWTIFGDADTASFMYQDNTDYTELIPKMDRINRFVQMNPFVQSIYIYNKKLNRFLATGNAAVNDADEFYDRDIVRIMEQPVPPQRLVPIPRKLNLSLDGSDQLTANVYTYVVYDILSQERGIEGAVIVNIKGDYLQNIMNPIRSQFNKLPGDTLVVDPQGVAVSDSQDRFLSDLSAQPYIRKVLRQDEGSFADTLNNRRFMVTYVSSGTLGWKFIQIEPYELIVNDIQRIRWLTIAVSLVLLSFGLLVSFLVSRRLYSPLQRLVDKVKQLTDGAAARKQQMNDVGFLNSAITEAYRVKRDSLMSRKNEFLKKCLLHSEHSPEALPAEFAKYGIRIDPHGQYLLVALRIDHAVRFAAVYPERDRALFRYSIGNSAHELFGSRFVNEAVDMGEDLLVLIATIDRESMDDAHKKLAESVKQIQDWCADHLKLSVSAAIGYVNEDFAEIHRAYREVLHISNHRLLFGHRSILGPESLKGQNTDPYKIPSHEESLLCDALVNGKKEEAAHVYEEIMHKVVQYSYNSILSSLHYLTYAVYNILNVIEGNSMNRFEVDFNSFTQRIYQMETIAEIDGLFYGLFEQITETVNGRKDKRSTQLVDTMTNLIDLNYMDKGLCLESIANTMKMSKVYLGKVFREANGLSVADYIVNIRLDKAMQLLNGEYKSLDSVLDKIGFENKKYFYTLFKKKFGITFSEYKLKQVRDSIQDGEEEG